MYVSVTPSHNSLFPILPLAEEHGELRSHAKVTLRRVAAGDLRPGGAEQSQLPPLLPLQDLP